MLKLVRAAVCTAFEVGAVFLTLVLGGCAGINVEWQRSGACVDLCKAARPMRTAAGAALWVPGVCRCNYDKDYDGAAELFGIDLKTLQCVP